MIFGGGGVTPDFIVKADTLTKSGIEVFASAAIFDYTKDFVSANGASMHKQYTADAFLKNFSVSDETINSLVAKAQDKIAKAEEKAGKPADKRTKLDPKELETDRSFLKDWIRSEIGYQLFGYDVRAKILLKTDKQFQKAYSLVGEAQKMSELFK
jgi:hypothetical protein